MKRLMRLEILLLAVTVLSLGAGLATGLLTSRLPAAASPTAAPTAADQTPLVQQLQLTADQRDKMRDIWENARSRVRQTYEQAQRLQTEREDALVALLNDEQKAKFAKIARGFADRYAELTASRNREFQEAVQQTRQLLNEQQRLKYEQILKTQVGPDAPGLPPTTGLGSDPSLLQIPR